MEAKQSSIAYFMRQPDTQFTIPVYQRNYDWRNEQCKQLLADILTAGNAPETATHFVGSVVYLQTNITSTPHILTIIDGQQRLTTLTLLWLALHRRAKEQGNHQLATKIERQYIINEFLDGDEKVKLRPIKKDDKALHWLMKNDGTPWEFGYSRLIENFLYFYESITPERIEFVSAGMNRLVFIEIALERGKDDPQRIFQSLNSTGLDLSQADLIRNLILMDLPHKIQLELYENYWEKIEISTQQSTRKESKLSEFMRDFLTFKFREIPNLDRVFETFKQKYSGKTLDELKELLGEIRTFSSYYNRFINPGVETDSDIEEHLRLIAKIPITVSYPFLLEVYHDYATHKIGKQECIAVLELVQSYAWRRFMCDLPTNALNKVFTTLYKDVNYDNYLGAFELSLIRRQGKHRFPTDDEIMREIGVKDMYNIRPSNRLYFLERLENYGHRIKTNVENNEDVTIEHIFPQKPTRAWEIALGAEFDTMKSLVNTAANLTFSAFNSSLSNRPFPEKRDLPEKGYKASILRLDKMLAKFTAWNPTSLQERREWIEQRFLEVWRFPYAVKKKMDDEAGREAAELAVDILELDPNEATNKMIVRVDFEDLHESNISWRQLLAKIASKMFEREPEVFFALHIEDKIWTKTDPNSFSAAVKISEQYYIEGSFSAKGMIKRIQLILNRCETDEECLIVLKPWPSKSAESEE